jgi:hypothetical protein
MQTPAAPTPPVVPELLRIRPGQSQLRHWPAGTAVMPLGGGVWLSETPRWLAEQLLRPRLRIEAHATHVLRDSGWVVLWAEHDTVLSVLPGPQAQPWPPVVQPLRDLVVAAWRRVRGRVATTRLA